MAEIAASLSEEVEQSAELRARASEALEKRIAPLEGVELRNFEQQQRQG